MSDDNNKNPESGKKDTIPDMEDHAGRQDKDGTQDEYDDGPSPIERYAVEDAKGDDEKSADDSRAPGVGGAEKAGRVPPRVEGGYDFDDEDSAPDDFDAAYDFSDEPDGVDEFADNFEGDGMPPPPPKKKKAGAGMRFVAPLAVLLMAGGVGGYIVMNPDVMGGGSPQVVPASVPQSVSTSVMPDSRQVSRVADSQPEQPGVADRAQIDRPLDGGSAGGNVTGADTDNAMLADGPEFPVSVESDDGFAAGDTPRPPSMEPVPFSDTDSDTDETLASEASGDSIPDFGGGDDLDMPENAFDEPSSMAAVEKDDAPLPDETLLESNGEEEAAVAAIEDDAGLSLDIAAVEPSSSADKKTQEEDRAESVTPKPPAMPVRDRAADSAVSAASAALARPVRTAQNSSGNSRYFDAGSQVPTGRMATEIGPRKVDPTLEPAQKYMIVTDSKDEKDPEALLATANKALKLQRYDAAIDMFEQLYARNDRDPRILMGLAVSLQKAGRTEASLSIYDELLEVAPNDKSAVVNMLGLLRGQYPSVAVRRLMDLQRQYPNDPMIAAQLGVTLADMGDYGDAAKYLETALSVEPRNAQHYMNLAVIADRQGDRGNAISYYEEALHVDAVYGNGRSVDREMIYDRLSVLRR